MDGVFDIETEDWTTFVVGGAWDGCRFVHDADERRFADFMLSREGIWLAWNGGRYDFLWLLQHAIAKGLNPQVSLAGSRLTSVRLGKLTLRDPSAMFPVSLELAASWLGKGKGKLGTGLPCVCCRDCGGYCSIKRDMPREHWRVLLKYLRRDCTAVWDVMSKWQAFASTHDLETRATVGGASYAQFVKQSHAEPTPWVTSGQYKLARAGYHGGRVQLFQPRAPRRYSYDINSAYPWAISVLELPVGEPVTLTGKSAQRGWDNGLEGIYHGRVIVPDSEYPPLPMRHKGRTYYPYGEFAGAWPRNELNHAIEHGTRFLPSKAVCWHESAPITRDFAERIWSLRARFMSTPFLKTQLKFYANSFTGKCGQSPEQARVVFTTDPSKIVVCDCKGTCVGRCGAWRALDTWGTIWAVPQWRLPDNAHVQWAAYLTAHVRIALHSALLACAGSSPIYCDTDSVKLAEPAGAGCLNTGDGLGQWKFEGVEERWFSLGPKAYVEGQTAKLKGVSDVTPEVFEAFAAGQTIASERGVKTFKSALKSETLFSKKRITRSHLGDGRHYGDRVLLYTGRTWPVAASSLYTSPPKKTRSRSPARRGTSRGK